MTALTKPVSRQTAKLIGSLPVIVTIAPCGSQQDARVAMRLKGRRTQYVCLLSDLYRIAAMWHGQKLAEVKKQARRHGIAWRIAKKQFDRQNRI